MATLLLELVGSPTLNRTIFPPHLKVFDDLLIYKRRSWFVVREITVSYHQISQVMLTKGLFFASLDVINTGEEDIRIRWISKKDAQRAKDIIDQKMYHSHAKHNPPSDKLPTMVGSFEKTLNRLQELLNKGQITEKEFLQKKNEMIKKL